jgi:hypothetical protein
MNTDLLRTAGQIAGIGGLAIVALVRLYRDVIRLKAVDIGLDRDRAYRLLRLIVVLAWIIALAGIGAFVITYIYAPLDKNVRRDETPSALQEAPGGEKKVTIKGQVREQSKGLAGATIQNGHSGTATSNSDGWFSLEVAETSPGWARISVSKEGYDPWEDFIQTRDGIIVSLQKRQR